MTRAQVAANRTDGRNRLGDGGTHDTDAGMLVLVLIPGLSILFKLIKYVLTQEHQAPVVFVLMWNWGK